MITESNDHLDLKKFMKAFYLALEYTVKEEHKIGAKIVDLAIYKNNKLIKIIECLHSQSITKALEKLLMIKNNCQKEIIRFYRPKNPKARKIIKIVENKGILFTELTHFD